MSEETILRRLDLIEDMLHRSHINEERIMSGLDNLKASVAALQAEEALVVAAIQDLQKAQGDPDATVQSLSDQINSSVAALQAAIPAVATATQPVTGASTTTAANDSSTAGNMTVAATNASV